MGSIPAAGQASAIRRVLIVKTSSIGDVVHALPFASILGQRRPDLFIGWVVRKRCADLLAGNSDIDRVYVIPDRPRLADLWTLRQAMRRDQYDAALDMQGLLMSGIITWLSGAQRRIGLDLNREGNRWFLTEPTVPARENRERHAIDILRGFLPVMGIEEDAAWPKLPYLADGQTVPEDVTAATRSLGKIALNIGASSIYKQWPAVRWSEFAALLMRSGFTPVLVGGLLDVTMAVEVQAAAESAEPHRQLVNVVGKTTLRGTAAVIAACDALVSGDTGPLHLGVALGKPVVALYGPTRPTRTGPYGSNSAVIWKGLPCGPCHRRPICEGRADCMRAIEPAEVLGALEQLLSRESAVH